MMIRITVDTAQALAALNKINAAQIKSRLTGGVQRTVETARQEIIRRVTARYVRPDFAINSLKTSVSGLNGKISSTDRRHGLTQYVVNPNTRPPHNPPGGLNIKVRRSDNERLPHAFIGRGQAFERVGASRLPIRRLTGAAGSQMVGSKHIAPQVETLIQKKIAQEIERAIL